MLNQQKPRTFIPSKYTRYTVHTCSYNTLSVLVHSHITSHTHTHTQLQRTVGTHKATVDSLRARLAKEQSQSQTVQLTSQLTAKEVSRLINV